MKVLLVEDEPRIASFVTKGLEAAGYETEHVTTGGEAIDRASDADVIVLDLGLPDIDGMEVLHRIRADGLDAQVIVLTARAELDDRVEGLERGADDYLVKPFAFEELLARIRARVRSLEQVERRHLRFDGIRMDLLDRRVSVDGRLVELSARQFELLEVLVRAEGEVRSREQLLEQVWGLAFDPGTNVVDVYIGYLRRKIGAERIETVRTRGYRLVGAGAAAPPRAEPG